MSQSQTSTQGLASFFFDSQEPENRPMPISPRMRKYIRRLATKTKATFRARRGLTGATTTSASRTLSKAVGQYRYANPMYIQPSNARTISFWRTVSYSITLNESLGWGASGTTSLNFAFTLGNVLGWLGGGYSITLPVTNSSEFQSLFDTYKIPNVRMKMFFTNNNSSVNSPATGMPLLHIANDFDDAQENMTAASILERAGVRTFQFDATNSQGVSHWVKPSAKQTVSQVDPATGVQTVSNAGVSMGNQWIDVAASNIIHNGVKLVYNNQGRNNNTDIGSMTFIFEIEYTFKGYR